MDSREILNTIITATTELTEAFNQANNDVSEVRIIRNEEDRLKAIKEKFSILSSTLSVNARRVEEAMESTKEEL